MHNNKAPATPAKTRKTGAQYQAEYRARKGKQINVILSEEAKAGLDAYIQRHHKDGQADMTISQVFERLLTAQLLRKR